MNTTPQELNLAPASEPQTTWTNPTEFAQYIEVEVPCSIVHTTVDESGNRRQWTQTSEQRRITWSPGETKAIPSRWDRLVHMVLDCGHAECRKAVCRRPADAPATARVCGGAAPLLQREGQRYGIDASLVVRPSPPRSVAVAPAEVAARMASGGGADDEPALERARARRKAAGR